MLLAVSLVCNITALIIPFMEINIFLKGKELYSLPHSVKLMWEADLFLIAILVVGFSIVFPFVKLALLGRIWFLMKNPVARRALLERLEPLGKWSFLDIYIVCIILVLTNDQVFIGADPRVGLYLFVAAISMSMVTAMLMEPSTRLEQEILGADDPRSLASIRDWQRWVVPPLLAMSLVGLLAAIGLPYLEISQFLMAGRSYSIVVSVGALWSQDAYVVSIAVAVTLITLPLLSVLAMVFVWFARLDRARRRRWNRLVQATWQWAMLEVFGLALLVFLLEGRSLVKTEIKPGLWLVVGATAVVALTRIVVDRRSNRASI